MQLLRLSIRFKLQGFIQTPRVEDFNQNLLLKVKFVKPVATVLLVECLVTESVWVKLIFDRCRSKKWNFVKESVC